MPIQDESDFSRTRKLVFLSLLASLAIIIHFLELSVPGPLPWMRLGLANIITLTALYLFGFWDGMIVNILRIILGAFISGTLFSPAFILSFSAGITSSLAMGFLLKYSGRTFSLSGISLIGAYIHICTQLIAAYFLLIKHAGIFTLLPLLLIIAFLSGILNGYCAQILSNHLIKILRLD